jgi:hypothetical protein
LSGHSLGELLKGAGDESVVEGGFERLKDQAKAEGFFPLSQFLGIPENVKNSHTLKLRSRSPFDAPHHILCRDVFWEDEGQVQRRGLIGRQTQGRAGKRGGALLEGIQKNFKGHQSVFQTPAGQHLGMNLAKSGHTLTAKKQASAASWMVPLAPRHGRLKAWLPHIEGIQKAQAVGFGAEQIGARHVLPVGRLGGGQQACCHVYLERRRSVAVLGPHFEKAPPGQATVLMLQGPIQKIGEKARAHHGPVSAKGVFESKGCFFPKMGFLRGHKGPGDHFL